MEGLLKRISFHLGGDMAAAEAARILRVPGTWNLKHDPKRRVSIRHFHPEKQYNLIDFDFLSLLPPPGEREGREQPHAPGWEKDLLKGVSDGERNISITKLAGRYIGKGLSIEEIIPILFDANSRFAPPLEMKEVETILNSVIKTDGRNHPDRPAEQPVEKAKDHHFNLISAKDVVSSVEPEADYLWDGSLPAGGLGILVAKPKVGKTTFGLRLAVAVSRGDDFLGRKTQKGNVVYLALEEKRGEVQKYLSSQNVSDENLYFHFGLAPVEAVKEVGPLVEETQAKLLVIDILQKFCRVKDLNDYAQVTRALEPLMATARQLNCHILLLHHAGKRDRDDGDDILGSTGLLGGVDTSIHIKKREKRRSFFTIQRYGADIPETVLTLQPDGSLEATGSREEVEINETMPLILEVLGGGPLTEKEVGERVERNRNLISKALRKLVDQGDVKRGGSGKRGDPFLYSLLLYSDTIEYSNRESFSGDNSSKSKKSFSIDDFQKNGFSIDEKKEEKDPTKGGLYEVLPDGQITY